MGAIPENVIIMWGGTHAGIPTGWSRVTSLDDKHPKASGSEAPDTTGGSNTHTHTATAHSHTMDSHTHSVALTNTGGSASAQDVSGGQADNHSHDAANIGGVSGGTSASEAKDWQSVNSEPPYYKMIFIKPTSGSKNVPDDGLHFWYSATAPTGFAHCDGTGGTPDLRNKYIKGSGTGADAGAGSGGTTHTHTITHTHTGSGHTHSANSAAHNTGTRGGSGGPSSASSGHTHNITLSSTTDTIGNSSQTSGGGSDTVEVAYKKVACVQNTSGAEKPAQIGAIALWLGSTATIPGGWHLCDGTAGTPDLADKYIKVINTTGELGNTGGSNTHTHTSVAHTHSGSTTHNHSTGTSGTPSATGSVGGGGSGYAPNTHTHTWSSVGSTTASYASTSMDSGSAVNHEPAYRTAAYIQLISDGGGFFQFML